jgi:hypothetical protein
MDYYFFVVEIGGADWLSMQIDTAINRINLFYLLVLLGGDNSGDAYWSV